MSPKAAGFFFFYISSKKHCQIQFLPPSTFNSQRFNSFSQGATTSTLVTKMLSGGKKEISVLLPEPRLWTFVVMLVSLWKTTCTVSLSAVPAMWSTCHFYVPFESPPNSIGNIRLAIKQFFFSNHHFSTITILVVYYTALYYTCIILYYNSFVSLIVR